LLYAWLPNFFYDKFSLGLTRAGFIATIYVQSANLVGLFVGGMLGDRLYRQLKSGRFWLTTAGLLLTAPGVYLIGNSRSLAATEIAAMTYGFGSGLFMANFIVGVMEVVPVDVRASCVGVYNLMGSLVSGFAPWLGGVWKDSVGLPSLMTYAGLLSLLAAAVVVLEISWLFAKDFRAANPKAIPLAST
jgi:MFS family permease